MSAANRRDRTPGAGRQAAGCRAVAGLLVLAALALGGCASVAPPGGPGAAGQAPAAVTPGGAAGLAEGRALSINPVDPWERWNRRVYGFNEAIDRAVLKPVAEGYVRVVPSFVRQGVSNVGQNFGDAWSAVNNLLQGKFEFALNSIMRVATNTVFGLGGLLDIASEAGIERHPEDLGQTLGRWGVPAGPYMVLPVFGPSTVRDTATFVPDRAVSPTLLAPEAAGRAALISLYAIDTRATLLPATRMLDTIALDKYSFVRDAYLQRRQNDIYDGNPPAPPGDDPAAGTDAPAAPAAPADNPRMHRPGQPSPPSAR